MIAVTLWEVFAIFWVILSGVCILGSLYVVTRGILTPQEPLRKERKPR
jgi:hypothetical protein